MNKKRHFLLLIPVFILLSILFLYLRYQSHDENKFYQNTRILNILSNETIDVSGMTVGEVEAVLNPYLNNKKIEIIRDGNVIDTISYKELKLTTNLEQEIAKAKRKNDSVSFLESFLRKTYSIEFKIAIQSDEIDEIVPSLNCIKNYKKAKDATIKKTEDGYRIVAEQPGTELNQEIFKSALLSCLENQKGALNLDDGTYYLKPKVTSEDKDLKQRIQDYNDCTNIRFTYVFGTNKETITKEQLQSWISFNKKNQMVFDEDAMLQYIKSLAAKYNTFGKPRTFTTSNHNTITIKGGDYGWSISQTREVEKLKEDILNKKDVEREPLYLYSGYGSYKNGNDIGDSYVEISISRQHIWLYSKGKLIIDSSLVSGDIAKGYGTPSGVYGLTYKEKNRILRGPGYAAPVSYWMPFNGGIGMHDATWRNSFGGTIYKRNGSHGCINLPFNVAKTIYNYVERNYPVVVY